MNVIKRYNRTQSLCSACGKKIDATIVEKDGAVYLEKICPDDGITYSIVSSDAEWYRKSLRFIKPMTHPKQLSVDSFVSCPESCGLCPEHGQHTCLPVIEINSTCNMNCPVCLKTWNDEQNISLQEFEFILDTLIACEGFIPVINLSGGEPTMHPDLIKMLEMAKSKGIMQVSISTNGIRLAEDKHFRKSIAPYDPLIALQFDGFDPQTYVSLRGADLSLQKSGIVEILEQENFKYSLVATIANDVNIDEVTDITDFFFRSKALSLMFQPVAYTGKAKKMKPSMNRATIPDVIKEIEKSSYVEKGDFNPLPCSHPSCFALSYYIDADNGIFVSMKNVMGEDNYLNVISNRTLPGLDIEGFQILKDKVYDIWSAADQFPNSEHVLKKIRNVINELNKNNFNPQKVFDIGSKTIKAIFIHQFMDKDTVDFGRLMKCCNHYPKANGKLIPMCVQNVCLG
jgi:7,8-dihydro-6-hydroxymethylpterin dimethyltransferase